MDEYAFISDCLREIRYPNIESMDEEDILNIYVGNNRHFLVSYILKQTDPEYESLVANTSNDELGEIIYELGFCTKEQQSLFMNGTLENEQQLAILFRLLKNLKHIWACREITEVPEFLPEEINDAITRNINLFPEYGPKKTLTMAQKRTKIEQYKKEIEELKTKLATTTGNENIRLDPHVIQDLDRVMASLELKLPEFVKKAKEALEQDSKTPKQELDPSCEKTLQEAAEAATQLQAVVEKAFTTRNFTRNPPSFDLNHDNSCEYLRDVAKLCMEVTALEREK